MLLEKAGEGGLLSEAEAVGDGLYARFRLVGERLFQLYNKVMLNPVAGQRVSKAQKGIYLVNGKKVIVK